MSDLATTLTLTDSPMQSIFAGILPAVEQLFVRSDNFDDLMSRPRIAIVGSRKISPYGKQVTTQFASELAKQGIVIVSGLAYGVDAVAHRAVLEAGGLTMAVLPSSIEDVYPRAHKNLSEEIVQGGGALISEYPAGTPAYKWNFVERNRIVSGIADALLITEAAINSGTMHTARFALEQGKDVLAIPGNITSPISEGTNNLIKTGAITVTSPEDVLHILGIKSPVKKPTVTGSDIYEQTILDLIAKNVTDGNHLLKRSNLPADQFSHVLTMLEITGKVRSLGNNHWSVI